MSMNVAPGAQSAVHGNDFELIPMAEMESQHSAGWPICREFPQFVIILEISRPEIASR